MEVGERQDIAIKERNRTGIIHELLQPHGYLHASNVNVTCFTVVLNDGFIDNHFMSQNKTELIMDSLMTKIIPLIMTKKFFFLCLILFIGIYFFNQSYPTINDHQLGKQQETPDRPTLARSLYMYLCENQAEVDAYLRALPTITADVMLLCWKENCSPNKALNLLDIYVSHWSSKTDKRETLVYRSANEIPPEKRSFYRHVRSRIFILNEKELNLKEKLTWTTSRNKMYDTALEEEIKQGWRWAYFNFGDGDVHVTCPMFPRLISQTPQLSDEENVFAHRFYSFYKITPAVDEAACYLIFDAFLLTVSPAISFFSGHFGPMTVPGYLTEVAYHIDAMFNAIHRDAAPFVLPYCPKYDAKNWWTSQAIFVYRSLCVFGHILRFDAIQIGQQTHRNYPRDGSPWQIGNDMNLVPAEFLQLQAHMKQHRFVSPMYLRHYNGWNIGLASDTCRRNHTAMNVTTCLVYGETSRNF